MTDTILHLNQWSAIWAGLMWAVLWQSTLLIVVVALIARLLRRGSPVVRYWLWQIVAIKLLLMPFWTLAIPMPSWYSQQSPGVTVLDGLPEETAPPEQLASPLPPAVPNATPDDPPPQRERPWDQLREVTWRSWLLTGYLATVFWQLVRLWLQRVRLKRLLRGAAPAEDETATMVHELAVSMELRHTPSVRLTKADCPLFVCGLRQPVLVVPAGLPDLLDPSQLRQALLHELAHLKRRDLLWGWIVELARIVYFFHPLVYWLGYRLHLERELACDQLAMAVSGGTAAEYTQTLIEVVSHTSQPAALKTPQAVSAGLDGHAASWCDDKAADKES